MQEDWKISTSVFHATVKLPRERFYFLMNSYTYGNYYKELARLTQGKQLYIKQLIRTSKNYSTELVPYIKLKHSCNNHVVVTQLGYVAVYNLLLFSLFCLIK